MRPPVDGDVVRRFGGTSQGGRRSDGVAWRTQKGAVVRAPLRESSSIQVPLRVGAAS
ncbi:MAG: hypothetical protein WDM92_06830 [Caulobacteraceae bacterium]